MNLGTKTKIMNTINRIFTAATLYNAQAKRVWEVSNEEVQLFRMRGELEKTGSKELIPFMKVLNLKCIEVGDITKASKWEATIVLTSEEVVEQAIKAGFHLVHLKDEYIIWFSINNSPIGKPISNVTNFHYEAAKHVINYL